MTHKIQRGFSLMEIIIVLLIVALLTIVLMPAYNNYITKSRRSDGIKSLMAMQIAQEKYRLTNTDYASSPAALNLSTNSIDGYYTMAVTTNTTSTYAITATATSGGGQTADTGCTTLTITYANNTATNTPTACWQ